MSATAISFYALNTATRDETFNPREAVIFGLANRIMQTVGDRSLYEDDTEPQPNTNALVAATIALSKMDELFRDSCEIEPYWGQLSLVWRSGREKRVKATFGAEGTLSIYHERMAEGKVVDSGMEIVQDDVARHLANRLAWL